ncbi:hypothetical protein [Ferrovibrio sp.]|uniref:hypothetical protein n=1 Tax=Ferrovibrio sp. TaxID=1917215 RepID=UPI001B3E22F4|nr:hypothetical protein [Ferrovibrio sp.]MBP7062716.1 hypothetical protein [Ferrovibrio sp.]
MTSSQNHTQPVKPNVLSNLDKRVADGVIAAKALEQAKHALIAPAAGLPLPLIGPAMPGDNSNAKQ